MRNVGRGCSLAGTISLLSLMILTGCDRPDISFAPPAAAQAESTQQPDLNGGYKADGSYEATGVQPIASSGSSPYQGNLVPEDDIGDKISGKTLYLEPPGTERGQVVNAEASPIYFAANGQVYFPQGSRQWEANGNSLCLSGVTPTNCLTAFRDSTTGQAYLLSPSHQLIPIGRISDGDTERMQAANPQAPVPPPEEAQPPAQEQQPVAQQQEQPAQDDLQKEQQGIEALGALLSVMGGSSGGDSDSSPNDYNSGQNEQEWMAAHQQQEEQDQSDQ